MTKSFDNVIIGGGVKKGERSAKDYEITLTGGNLYYLHLGYYKDGSISSGTDTFAINSIKLAFIIYKYIKVIQKRYTIRNIQWKIFNI